MSALPNNPLKIFVYLFTIIHNVHSNNFNHLNKSERVLNLYRVRDLSKDYGDDQTEVIDKDSLIETYLIMKW